MRLIDADLLMRKCEKWLKPKAPDEDEMVSVADIAVSTLMEIEEQPTAFDVEKVVALLEEELKLADDEKARCIKENPIQFDSAKGYANGIANAIDCVKGGLMPGENVRENQWISVREKLPKCGVPVAVLLQGQYPEDVIYEVAELVDLSTDTKIQGKYWYKKGCGYLQHPAYVDGGGCFPGYEVIAWMSLPEPYRREEQEHETD